MLKLFETVSKWLEVFIKNFRANPMEFRQKSVFQIVSHQMKYISKDPQTHTEVYSHHLEKFMGFLKQLRERFHAFQNMLFKVKRKTHEGIPP